MKENISGFLSLYIDSMSIRMYYKLTFLFTFSLFYLKNNISFI